MPVVAGRERRLFEHITVGRWCRFADWVRSIHPQAARNSLCFATLFTNEQLLELVDGHYSGTLTEEMMLMCCYDLLRGVVMMNMAFGLHLRVFYNSKQTPFPPFRNEQYIDLIRTVKKVTSAALIYTHMEDFHSQLLDIRVVESLHFILDWIQCRSGKTLIELADECVKGYNPAEYQEMVLRGTDMAHLLPTYF